jgi:hypothetical protein
MQNLNKLLANNIIFLLLTLSVISVAALLVPGFYGASDDIHIAWLYEMDKVVREGFFPARYVPDLSYGFGYPLFNFVFPLPFYLAEIFRLVGFSFVGSIKALFFVSTILSAYFMYFLLRELTNKYLSLGGSVLYVFTPYRATDLYVRGAIGEVVSFAFLPLIILSCLKIAEGKRINWKWIGVGALSVFSLITSHNISAYMFMPFVVLFIVICLLVYKERFKLVTYQFLLMGFLALLAGSFFWLPAIVESGLVKYSTVFDYKDHFPTIKQLTTPYFGYGASVPGPHDGISFFLGITNLFLIIIGSGLFFSKFKKFKKNQKILVIWALILLATSIFMMNHRSIFFWEAIPFIKFFQFPWRFLLLTTFASSLFVIALEPFKKSFVISSVVIMVAVLTTFNYFKPQDFLGRQDGYYLNRYIAYPEASDEYRLTGEEYLRLPLDTKIRPNEIFPRFYSDEKVIKEVVETNSLNATAVVNANKETTVSYNKYLFPGWKVYIDKAETSIFPGNPYGQISFNIEAGQHEVKVVFQETSFRKVLDYLSLLSLITITIMIVSPKSLNRLDLNV